MHFTYQEIRSQPQAWAQAWQRVDEARAALQALGPADRYAQVLFVGCGSTYHLGQAAAAQFQALLGVPAVARPGGEVLLYPETVYPRAGRLLLVALSRSGTTTETVRAVEAFRALQHGPVLVFTNDPKSPLARLGDLTLAVEAGQERSVVQTRSFASLYVAVTAWTLLWAGDEEARQAMRTLPSIGERLLTTYENATHALAAQPWRLVFVLGGGPRYGLAAELALKVQETTLTPALAYPFLDFRHGPKSLIDPATLIVGLRAPGATATAEMAVLEEARALGGHILTIGEEQADWAFHSGLPASARGVLYLPLLQLWAYFRAVARGLNPDRPRHLQAVVEVDL